MSKRETVEQKVERLLDKKLSGLGSTVRDSVFTGVKYDENFTDVAQTIAEGFVANAAGLSKLADILASSNVTIESLLRIDGK